MRYWLMKSEPNVYSIDDLERDNVTHWEGVRNYQARNFMRDDMSVGDQVLFYHSNAKPPGIAGFATVSKTAYPDFFAWDPASKYFDSKSSPEKPIWMMVEVKFIKKLSSLISLDSLKTYPELAEMMVLRKGSRLSVQPVEKKHFDFIKTTLST
ncbi:EVE domain-containing protein [Candidatus Marinamargulisbacteria bacterium SCGC AG-343-D04]|nr:EVE domain-containing protein [Candidatus Marinamargulisbacteria bacterium SCGC AG-343-D04]